MNGTLKQITKDIVKDAAIKSASSNNGEVTNLTIKQILRNDGYEVYQNQVSGYMSELENEENWRSTNNGIYRTFIIPSTSNLLLTSPITPNTSSTSVKPNAVTPLDISDVNVSDWRALSLENPGIIYHFSAALTRSQARYAYAKLTGVSYNDVQAKRIV
jgi:hypothetical protein